MGLSIENPLRKEKNSGTPVSSEDTYSLVGHPMRTDVIRSMRD